MDAHIWEKLSAGLKEYLPTPLYSSIIGSITADPIENHKLKLHFPDNFTKRHFEDRCLLKAQEILSNLENGSVELVLEIPEEKAAVTPEHSYELFHRNPFDNKYTFESYVVGTSNQFAHAACQAVSQQPGQCYNPLFIFGGAGLGKTHLLRAIGYELHQQDKGLRILFLTSESFTNELIHAIRTDRMKEFREKYRTGCDVLLLDDVHFMAGKERTQEEFFYTFNYLHECRKQIVVTSDRYPKDIEGLEKRLQTRFEWGLVADVQPPEVETRIAILQNKADSGQIILPNEVAEYIATNITTNIRELEGSLHRLQAYASLTGTEISIELARQVLKDIAPQTKMALTADGILKLVALHFNIRTSDIKSEKRARSLSVPRQICMYLLRRRLLMSYPDIGKFMGGKDHTTVLHGARKISKLLQTDPEILKHTTAIESLIR